MKICTWGYNTTRMGYIYCPYCGKELSKLTLCQDGTYEGELKPCFSTTDSLSKGKVYYYRVSLIDPQFVYIYNNRQSTHFVLDTNIKNIIPIQELFNLFKH